MASSSQIYCSHSLNEIIRLPVWRKLSHSLRQLSDWITQTQIALTEIPSPTFHESNKAQYMAERFRDLGLEQIQTDSVGNVIAERPGYKSNKIWITAHLDTVVSTRDAIIVKHRDGRLCAPGISDNGAGLASLLGITAALSKCPIETNLGLNFVANVGEEGEGDLMGMRHLFSQRDHCRHAAGVIVLDGGGSEHVTVAGIGSRRFIVELSGPGGHSWNHSDRVNPIRALSAAICMLSQVDLPSEPRTTLNIGAIQGGSAVNAIPQKAWMKVDIRSTDKKEISRLARFLDTFVHKSAEQESKTATGKLEVRIQQIGDRPVAELKPEAKILKVIQEADQHLGIQTRLERASTDANIPLSLGIEAISIGGGGRGGEAHSSAEWFDPSGRELGLKRILLTTLMLAGIRAG
ncbi:MAG: hypothetical protein A3F68_07475 [Acidobacteria bacterium RIFCSPLOWO2_12_FULL_54_10]|nr:MAG: hypothetical protein A3F68_07475 [Acidobacteria bacterium RIFCSPLOWO2_12_FULL_54_10]